MKTETMPITTAAFKRLRRIWRIFWALHHAFAALEQIEKLGPEGYAAADALRDVIINRIPD